MLHEVICPGLCGISNCSPLSVSFLQSLLNTDGKLYLDGAILVFFIEYAESALNRSRWYKRGKVDLNQRRNADTVIATNVQVLPVRPDSSGGQISEPLISFRTEPSRGCDSRTFFSITQQ